jgi:hypothetical protein
MKNAYMQNIHVCKQQKQRLLYYKIFIFIMFQNHFHDRR